MEPNPRYARRTDAYKSPVLLIKLIRHICSYTVFKTAMNYKVTVAYYKTKPNLYNAGSCRAAGYVNTCTYSCR